MREKLNVRFPTLLTVAGGRQGYALACPAGLSERAAERLTKYGLEPVTAEQTDHFTIRPGSEAAIAE